MNRVIYLALSFVMLMQIMAVCFLVNCADSVQKCAEQLKDTTEFVQETERLRNATALMEYDNEKKRTAYWDMAIWNFDGKDK